MIPEISKQYALVWAAALESAWRDMWGRDKMARREAVQWVRLMHDDFTGFAWCCEIFGLRADKVRDVFFTRRPPKKYAPIHGKYRGDVEAFNRLKQKGE